MKKEEKAAKNLALIMSGANNTYEETRILSAIIYAKNYLNPRKHLPSFEKIESEFAKYPDGEFRINNFCLDIAQAIFIGGFDNQSDLMYQVAKTLLKNNKTASQGYGLMLIVAANMQPMTEQAACVLLDNTKPEILRLIDCPAEVLVNLTKIKSELSTEIFFKFVEYFKDKIEVSDFFVETNEIHSHIPKTRFDTKFISSGNFLRFSEILLTMSNKQQNVLSGIQMLNWSKIDTQNGEPLRENGWKMLKSVTLNADQATQLLNHSGSLQPDYLVDFYKYLLPLGKNNPKFMEDYACDLGRHSTASMELYNSLRSLIQELPDKLRISAYEIMLKHLFKHNDFSYIKEILNDYNKIAIEITDINKSADNICLLQEIANQQPALADVVKQIQLKLFERARRSSDIPIVVLLMTYNNHWEWQKFIVDQDMEIYNWLDMFRGAYSPFCNDLDLSRAIRIIYEYVILRLPKLSDYFILPPLESIEEIKQKFADDRQIQAELKKLD